MIDVSSGSHGTHNAVIRQVVNQRDGSAASGHFEYLAHRLRASLQVQYRVGCSTRWRVSTAASCGAAAYRHVGVDLQSQVARQYAAPPEDDFPHVA